MNMKVPDFDMLKRQRRMGRKMTSLYKELDALFVQKSEGMKLSCTKGCDSCCHLLVLVPLPEAVAIAEHFLSDQRRKLLIPDVSRRCFEQITKIPLQPGTTEAFGTIRSAYFASKTPCALLDPATKTCTVYDVRPEACRYHYVTSDPAQCSPDRPGAQVSRLDTLEFDVRALSEARKVSHQTKMPLYVAPLPVALLWAFKLLIEGREAFDAALREPAEQLGALNLLGWTELLARDEEGQSVPITAVPAVEAGP